MFYRLLGMLVWNGGKALLRQQYGRTYMPKRVLAGAALAVAAAQESVLRFAPTATAVAATAARPTPTRSRPGGTLRPRYHFAPCQTANPSAL